METLPADVQELLDAHQPHFSATPEGKVKCELNGHMLPARADALAAFINGKKFKKLAAAAQLEAGMERYEPFIVQSRNLPGMLFCALTGELLNARLAEVKAHLKGKKFGRARARFEADEQELLEEPSLGGSDMEEDGPEDSDGPGVWVPEEVLREYEMGEAAEGEAEEQAGAEPAAGGAGNAAAEEPAGGDAGGGRKAKGKQQEGKRQKPKKEGKAAGAEGAKGKQRQQKAAAENGTGGGKGKAPRAKKARTG